MAASSPPGRAAADGVDHRSSPLGISVMIALCTLGLLALMAWQAATWNREAAQSAALMQARGLAAAVAQVDTSTEQGEALLQQRILGVPAQVGGLETLLVLEGTRFIAHTTPELAGSRLSRDSLEHKALYDDSKQLQGDLERNAEERSRDVGLQRNPFPTGIVRIEAGRMVAVSPVLVGGEMRGIVALQTRPPPLPAPEFALQLSLAAAALLAGTFLVGRLAPGVPAWIPGIGWLMAAAALVSLQVDASSSALRDRLGTDAAQLSSAFQAVAGEGADLEQVRTALNTDRMGATLEQVAAIQAGVKRDGDWIAAGTVSVQPGVDARVKATWAWRGLGLFGGFMIVFLGLLMTGRSRRISVAFVEHWYAYAYIAPAVIGTAVLVFGPFLFGIILGFYTRVYSTYEFVGLQNFVSILSDFEFTRNRNFYRTLAVTVFWTVINVSLHVGIGLGLAMILKDKSLRFTPVYRTLLVIPWALPNYITALIWKGMFNKEYGAINAFLALFGVEPVSWFNTFSGAFFANLVTNVWLGFPFMMVISLGALQSIPTDLYEAADVDGANRWQKFQAITLPLLKPALFPAIILGVIWTFNQFNVIYLVSGGAPDGETDILITEAYRWAFEGRQQYGYAAAYSTIIFLILFGYTYVTNKITKSTEGAYA